MFRAIVFRCPHLKGSNDGARCDAALCIAENNLIKHMEDADIKLCINKKRRFEACYIYFDELRRTAISRLPIETRSLDSRPHTFSSL
ncbi:MAG: hypothetical protein QMD44_01560 [Thermodesulfovibrionales bacterium]|jgi:hypothetical protein|nr:hypothetical protein [Thermodesulfovibrionales bacterium]